jgi:hypothetical protein
VRHLAAGGDAGARAALVAERDALPARWLADDGKIGTILIDDMPRADGIALFVERTDDDELPVETFVTQTCHRVNERCERSLSIDRATPVENIVLDPNINLARHRVDVTEQDNLLLALAHHADSIADLVFVGFVKTDIFHALDEIVDGVLFLPRGAVVLDEFDEGGGFFCICHFRYISSS